MEAEAGKPSASFTQGDLSRHLLRLSGNMIAGFLVMTVAQVVEALYLGVVGTDALAAVAFAAPVMMALGAATRGIGVGAGAALARAMGGGDRERAEFLTTHGLLLVLAFTVACAVLLAVFARPLFHLLGARGEVLDLVATYITISAVGVPLYGLAMVGTGLMRAIGDAVYPGVVLSVGSILQVLIGPWLIFGWSGLPAYGVAGAAWAFVIGRSLAFGISAYWFFVKERMIRNPCYRAGPGEPPALRRLADSCRTILHVGIPAMATNLIEPLSAAVITRMLATFGPVVVAGFGVAARIEAVVFMVVIGIASNTAPLVGQNWGAGKFDRVDAALALCYRYCLAWSVVAALVMWLGGPWFVSHFSDEPELTAVAVAYLYIIPASIGFAGMVNVANGSFNALAKPMPALMLSLLRLVVFYIPLALLASLYFGYLGIFAAAAVTNVALGIMAREWNRRTISRERQRATVVR